MHKFEIRDIEHYGMYVWFVMQHLRLVTDSLKIWLLGAR